MYTTGKPFQMVSISHRVTMQWNLGPSVLKWWHYINGIIVHNTMDCSAKTLHCLFKKKMLQDSVYREKSGNLAAILTTCDICLLLLLYCIILIADRFYLEWCCVEWTLDKCLRGVIEETYRYCRFYLINIQSLWICWVFMKPSDVCQHAGHGVMVK